MQKQTHRADGHIRKKSRRQTIFKEKDAGQIPTQRRRQKIQELLKYQKELGNGAIVLEQGILGIQQKVMNSRRSYEKLNSKKDDKIRNGKKDSYNNYLECKKDCILEDPIFASKNSQLNDLNHKLQDEKNPQNKKKESMIRQQNSLPQPVIVPCADLKPLFQQNELSAEYVRMISKQLTFSLNGLESGFVAQKTLHTNSNNQKSAEGQNKAINSRQNQQGRTGMFGTCGVEAVAGLTSFSKKPSLVIVSMLLPFKLMKAACSHMWQLDHPYQTSQTGTIFFARPKFDHHEQHAQPADVNKCVLWTWQICSQQQPFQKRHKHKVSRDKSITQPMKKSHNDKINILIELPHIVITTKSFIQNNFDLFSRTPCSRTAVGQNYNSQNDENQHAGRIHRHGMKENPLLNDRSSVRRNSMVMGNWRGLADEKEGSGNMIGSKGKFQRSSFYHPSRLGDQFNIQKTLMFINDDEDQRDQRETRNDKREVLRKNSKRKGNRSGSLVSSDVYENNQSKESDKVDLYFKQLMQSHSIFDTVQEVKLDWLLGISYKDAPCYYNKRCENGDGGGKPVVLQAAVSAVRNSNDLMQNQQKQQHIEYHALQQLQDRRRSMQRANKHKKKMHVSLSPMQSLPQSRPGTSRYNPNPRMMTSTPPQSIPRPAGDTINEQSPGGLGSKNKKDATLGISLSPRRPHSIKLSQPQAFVSELLAHSLRTNLIYSQYCCSWLYLHLLTSVNRGHNRDGHRMVNQKKRKFDGNDLQVNQNYDHRQDMSPLTTLAPIHTTNQQSTACSVRSSPCLAMLGSALQCFSKQIQYRYLCQVDQMCSHVMDEFQLRNTLRSIKKGFVLFIKRNLHYISVIDSFLQRQLVSQDYCDRSKGLSHIEFQLMQFIQLQEDELYYHNDIRAQQWNQSLLDTNYQRIVQAGLEHQRLLKLDQKQGKESAKQKQTEKEKESQQHLMNHGQDKDHKNSYNRNNGCLNGFNKNIDSASQSSSKNKLAYEKCGTGFREGNYDRQDSSCVKNLERLQLPHKNIQEKLISTAPTLQSINAAVKSDFDAFMEAYLKKGVKVSSQLKTFNAFMEFKKPQYLRQLSQLVKDNSSRKTKEKQQQEKNAKLNALKLLQVEILRLEERRKQVKDKNEYIQKKIKTLDVYVVDFTNNNISESSHSQSESSKPSKLNAKQGKRQKPGFSPKVGTSHNKSSSPSSNKVKSKTTLIKNNSKTTKSEAYKKQMTIQMTNRERQSPQNEEQEIQEEEYTQRASSLFAQKGESLDQQKSGSVSNNIMKGKSGRNVTKINDPCDKRKASKLAGNDNNRWCVGRCCCQIM